MRLCCRHEGPSAARSLDVVGRREEEALVDAVVAEPGRERRGVTAARYAVRFMPTVVTRSAISVVR